MLCHHCENIQTNRIPTNSNCQFQWKCNQPNTKSYLGGVWTFTHTYLLDFYFSIDGKCSDIPVNVRKIKLKRFLQWKPHNLDKIYCVRYMRTHMVRRRPHRYVSNLIFFVGFKYTSVYYSLQKHLPFDCDCFFRVEEWHPGMIEIMEKNVPVILSVRKNCKCGKILIFVMEFLAFTLRHFYVMCVYHFSGVVQTPATNFSN